VARIAIFQTDILDAFLQPKLKIKFISLLQSSRTENKSLPRICWLGQLCFGWL